MTADEFLAWLTPVAKSVCDGYGLPYGVLVAQGAIESGWGASKIGDYNIFGRKWNGEGNYIIVGTQEDDREGNLSDTTAKFQDYDSLESACDDWCQLMFWVHDNGIDGPYVQYARQYKIDGNVEDFVRGIASAYATDIYYANKILDTMKACDL